MTPLVPLLAAILQVTILFAVFAMLADRPATGWRLLACAALVAVLLALASYGEQAARFPLLRSILGR
jgi:hypothetical protein